MKSFASSLRKQYDRKTIKITASSTQKASGKFEVSVNGKLVHSKASGHGHLDTVDKWAKITGSIEAARVKKRASLKMGDAKKLSKKTIKKPEVISEELKNKPEGGKEGEGPSGEGGEANKEESTT
mmetsp:Transcript_2999/g.5755  ORF Transcript_2999/g.5755 Transcript_2999/m.5755 type:complete len:125 (+) Transcript_2999:97-471(+)